MIRTRAIREAWHPQTRQDRDAVLRELAEILSSPHFCNSKRYPALLRYVVENTLAGKSEFLKERTLGVEVFDRPPTYDTNADTVVRYTAGEVRKRLLLYYSEREQDSGIRISLSAGSYIPEFFQGCQELDEAESVVDLQAGSLPEAEGLTHAGLATHEPGWTALSASGEIVPAAPAAAGERSSSRRRLAQALIALLLIVLVAGSWWRYRAVSPQTAVDVFWAPVLQNQRTVMICTGSVVFDQKKYSGVVTASKDIDYPFLSLQTAFATAQISGMLERDGAAIQLASAASTPLTELREHSVTLVGGYNNLWTIRLLQPLRYHFGPDTDPMIVDSMQPQFRWQRDKSLTYSSADDYAIVARYRDATTDGWVVALAGLGRNGTEAAAQFASSPHYMQLLRDQAGSGFLNRNIEVVLKVSVIDGKTGAPSILAVHTW
ncbi:MAG: hypothetical protein WAN35_21095 [Terracidiphilus sp.]